MDIRFISSAGYDLFKPICPQAAYDFIWNGTGIDDQGGDWAHSGFGFETPLAAESGTNGLDASGMKKNSMIRFSLTGFPVNVAEYDILMFSVRILDWKEAEHLKISFHSLGDTNGETVLIPPHIDIYNRGWQTVYVPLSKFGLEITDEQGYVDRLEFVATAPMSIHLDNIRFAVGKVEKEIFTVCAPDMASQQVGEKSVQAHDIRPSVRVTPTNRKFPGPRNL